MNTKTMTTLLDHLRNYSLGADERSIEIQVHYSSEIFLAILSNAFISLFA